MYMLRGKIGKKHTKMSLFGRIMIDYILYF